MGLLKWALILGVVAVIAAVLGFTGIASGFAAIAKVLFYIFLAGVVLLVIAGIFTWKKIT